MGNVTDLQVHITTELASNAETNAYQAEGRTYPTPIRDKIEALIRDNELAQVMYGFFCVTNMAEVEDLKDLIVRSCLALRVGNAEYAIGQLRELAAEHGLADALWFHVGETYPDPDDNPHWKSIEVYYDIANIPEGHGHYLDFRNAAMDLIETALAEADAGEWVGAESGMGEVSFGFEVRDFDRAEQIVRATVKGTPYEGIREITRHEETADA